MRAWRVHSFGEPSGSLSLDEVPLPSPGTGELVVRVLSSNANFADVLLCRGEYQVKPSLPFTPGIELCGEIVAVGDDASTHQIGDRVIGCATLPYGGFSEFALMAGSASFAPPSDFNDAEAAAFHLRYQTAWIGLTRRANLESGETLLVHAAAGGVGSAAVQLGKMLGALVIGVAGGEEKCDIARSLGADVVIDRKTEDFVDVVRDITHGRGADVIFDPVGGETFRRSTKCIAFEGRVIVVGFAGGEISAAPLNHALVKNYSIVGLHWGLYLTRNLEVVRACQAELTRLANSGLVRPLISERGSMEELPQLLQRLADGVTIGRVSMACEPQLESQN